MAACAGVSACSIPSIAQVRRPTTGTPVLQRQRDLGERAVRATDGDDRVGCSHDETVAQLTETRRDRDGDPLVRVCAVGSGEDPDRGPAGRAGPPRGCGHHSPAPAAHDRRAGLRQCPADLLGVLLLLGVASPAPTTAT